MSAKLYYRQSVMNSGKSMQLLSTAYNLQERNIPFIVIKSSIDTRDDGVIKSRCIVDVRNCTVVKPEDNIAKVILDESVKSEEGFKWVLVDEVQFLTEEQIEQLSDIVDYHNINVMCYGLRTDFRTKLFPGAKRLFELADDFEEIKSMCACGNKAIINVRVDKDGKIITDGEQIEVGAEDKYITVCRKCYKKLLKNKKRNKK